MKEDAQEGVLAPFDSRETKKTKDEPTISPQYADKEDYMTCANHSSNNGMRAGTPPNDPDKGDSSSEEGNEKYNGKK